MAEYIVRVDGKVLGMLLLENPDLRKYMELCGQIVRCRDCRFRVDDVRYEEPDCGTVLEHVCSRRCPTYQEHGCWGFYLDKTPIDHISGIWSSGWKSVEMDDFCIANDASEAWDMMFGPIEE